MDAPSPRQQALFFELFESLPRQGPGDRASAERALALCRGLPDAPAVADLGCGTGGATLHLAERTGGRVVALDLHAPNVARLRAAAAARGLDRRVLGVVGDLARPPLAPGSLDLVASEGALYNAGLAAALPVCRALLRPGGYLVFSDAVWRGADPPEEVRATFADAPEMGTADDARAATERSGLALVGDFPLPDEAWWTDFYGPMERRLAELRAEHAGDAEALAALDELAREPDLHRRHGRWYGYHVFVARR